MKVLIVAKTRQGSGACIGGITFDGRSVRLIAANAATDDHAGLEYSVGEVWEIDADPAPQVIPPHVENIIVRRKRKMGPMSAPWQFIERHMPPVIGGPQALYDGLIQVAPSGALYIPETGAAPSHSTTFWRPDQPLKPVNTGKRLRYAYPTPDGEHTLVFVGFQEPLNTLPADTLLRVSLCHWWRRDDDPTRELRCYVQLSGWFPLDLEADGPGVDLPAAQALAAGGAAADLPAADYSAADGQTAPAAKSRRRTRADKRLEVSKIDLSPARRLLKTVFGHEDFWPQQAEIIRNVLARRDTLAVLPTGGGKSLCYQLPALLFAGLTVVVSPLIALMQDQVDQLGEMGAPAAYLNSTLDYRDYVATMQRARNGEIKLLYVSPETLLRPETLALLDQCRVDCLAIDEAHCISSWGHDFRPEYRQLLDVRTRYGAAVCIALTATATPRVQADIKERLSFDEANTFVASFNRPNLFLAAQPRLDGYSQILAFLDKHRGESGIIYCSTRDQVDRLAAQLAAGGWGALPYHAGLDAPTRARHQHQFVRDDAAIMVATIAFGMGIDKSNVRFVIHHNLPKNIENYYQEIGRAGRDGLRADCLLLFSQQDIATIHYFIDEGAASERPGRTARLQALVRFAQSQTCRRKPLLEYFGQSFDEPACGMCDNCLAPQQAEDRTDVTEAAQMFLRCVTQTGQLFGQAHIVLVLRGSRAQKVIQWRHDRLSTYNAGQTIPAQGWRGLAQEFISQGLLTQDMQHGSLHLTAKGQAVLAGEEKVHAAAAPIFTRVEPAADLAYDPILFEQLRSLRREQAGAANLPPYIVFSDRSLAEMATFFPQSSERFLDIDGVGQRKLERYGDRFLDVIRAYCRTHGKKEIPKASRMVAKTTTRTTQKKRFEEVGELFAAGHSVEDLQALYKVQRGTIVQHLYRYLQAGNPVDGERVLQACTLSGDRQQEVLAAFQEHGVERLSPVFEAFSGAVPYDELHILRLVHASRHP